ncbi:MAG: hypothetical protein IPH82_13455 [Chloroflexi bacterium]|nr:hypothetical protein [Chloroflexota bacterium]
MRRWEARRFTTSGVKAAILIGTRTASFGKTNNGRLVGIVNRRRGLGQHPNRPGFSLFEAEMIDWAEANLGEKKAQRETAKSTPLLRLRSTTPCASACSANAAARKMSYGGVLRYLRLVNSRWSSFQTGGRLHPAHHRSRKPRRLSGKIADLLNAAFRRDFPARLSEYQWFTRQRAQLSP